jgi:spore maturation protein CgeB
LHPPAAERGMTGRPLSVVVLGLSLSSSWGNGHATTWRALLRSFAARGHDVLFLERDVPWYADNRDLTDPPYCDLRLYRSLGELNSWLPKIAAADAVIVGSFVPEGIRVCQAVQAAARGITAFYDIDTPITLAKLRAGDHEYISPEIIPKFDVYLSFTGGPTLDLLRDRYGARVAMPLWCSVDADAYRPMPAAKRWDLSYLGTYSDDRQSKLDRLLIKVARKAPDLSFAVAGPQYPTSIEWPANVERLEHVAPAEHVAFYCASRFTLNVTRREMILAGYSPSVRLFEAAACGVPIVSDEWPGIDTFFTPGEEIFLVGGPGDVEQVLRDREKGSRVGAAGRARVMAEHTSDRRAEELERLLESLR